MTAPKHENIDQLLNRIRQCSSCEGLPLGPKPILQASPQAKLLIVGQAPGRITHAKGTPFDDPSGNRLRDWLGVDRQTFYHDPRIAIIPMGFCFPGTHKETGKSGDMPPRPECSTQWRKPLLSNLPNIELTILMGRYAIDWHKAELKGQSITKICQNWRDHWPSHIILPHPSPRNNRWLNNNPWFEDEILPILKSRIADLLTI